MKNFLICSGILLFSSCGNNESTDISIEKTKDQKETIDTSNDKSAKEATDKIAVVIKTSHVVGIKDKVHFYGEPDPSAKQKSFFVKGQTAANLGSRGSFTKVDFEFKGKHTIGYVLTSDIGPFEESEESEDDEMYENETPVEEWAFATFYSDQLTVYSDSKNMKAIGKLTDSEVFSCGEIKNGYMEIDFDNKMGWVKISEISQASIPKAY